MMFEIRKKTLEYRLRRNYCRQGKEFKLDLLFDEPILTLFGGRVNDETFAFAKEVFLWITLGIPFYMFGQAMNLIIRSDGRSKFAMISTVSGAVTNIIQCFCVYLYMMPLAMVNKGTFIFLQALGKAKESLAVLRHDLDYRWFNLKPLFCMSSAIY